jgi:hypothetical protein
MTDKNLLQDHVNSIASDLSKGKQHDYCPECGKDDWEDDCCQGYVYRDDDGKVTVDTMTGYDYISDALDIQYIVDGEKNYLAARILVAFGGPNIWINTQTNVVEGYWWGDCAHAHFEDTMGVDDATMEIWGCK